MIAVLLGCGDEAGGGATGKIVIRSEAYFTDKPGEVIGPLQVQVLSPQIRGVLGRSGARDPVPGAPVLFTVRDLIEGAPSPRLLSGPGEAGDPGNERVVPTDARGEARVWVRLPKVIGEWRVRAGVRGQFEEDRTVAFGIASGVKVLEAVPGENYPGRKVQVAVRLYQVDLDKGLVAPDDRGQVQFRIDGPSSGGARLRADRLADRKDTNDEGVAIADLFLGERSGYYTVLAEPWSDSPGEVTQLPAVVLSAIAIDWTRAALDLLGGALLFLLGLRLLSGGLLPLLGPALALPVTDFPRSRLRGFAGGLAAGALFQSRTIVVSRLISFSNGGLLAAGGALAVVLGADIGRTLLPQALALPIGPAAVGLLFLGALGLFLPRRMGVQGWGWVLLGAGLLVLGASLLQDGVEIMALSRSLRTRLGEWGYRGDGLSAAAWTGLLASTAGLALVGSFLLRSTNLLVVASIILAREDLISPAAALAAIIGANLGPALALFAASLRRSLEARRVALLQLAFHAVGFAWFGGLSLVSPGGAPLPLHLVEWATPGALFHPLPEQVGHHLAMVHTLYNLLNGLLCLALAGPLLRLVEKFIPRDPVRDDIKPYHLDQNLIEVPALAILQSTREVTYLTEMCRKAIAESFDSFRYRDLKLAEQTVRREESIDSVHRDVSQYLLRIGENDLSRRESSRLSVLQATTGNLVRIGKLGERLRDLTTREIDENVELPEEVARDLTEIYDLVMGQFDNVLQLLERPDGRTEENAVKVAERLAKFSSRVEQSWFEKVRLWDGEGGGSRTPEVSAEAAAPHPPAGAPRSGQAPAIIRTLIFRDALETLFHVAGHLSHIAERMRVLSPKN